MRFPRFFVGFWWLFGGVRAIRAAVAEIRRWWRARGCAYELRLTHVWASPNLFGEKLRRTSARALVLVHLSSELCFRRRALSGLGEGERLPVHRLKVVRSILLWIWRVGCASESFG